MTTSYQLEMLLRAETAPKSYRVFAMINPTTGTRYCFVRVGRQTLEDNLEQLGRFGSHQYLSDEDRAFFVRAARHYDQRLEQAITAAVERYIAEGRGGTP